MRSIFGARMKPFPTAIPEFAGAIELSTRRPWRCAADADVERTQSGLIGLVTSLRADGACAGAEGWFTRTTELGEAFTKDFQERSPDSPPGITRPSI
jgi:hypothetical protein